MSYSLRMITGIIIIVIITAIVIFLTFLYRRSYLSARPTGETAIHQKMRRAFAKRKKVAKVLHREIEKEDVKTCIRIRELDNIAVIPNIDAVVPNIDAYMIQFRNGDDDAALRIGDLYAHGIHPYYGPDVVAARHIFEMIASSRSPAAHDAELKLIELNSNVDANKNDACMNRLDVAHVWEIRDVLNSRARVAATVNNSNFQIAASNTRIHRSLFDEMLEDDHVVVDDAAIARSLGGSIAMQQRLLDEAQRAMTRNVYRADKQNVHDTTAQNMAVARLNAISDKSPINSTFEKSFSEFSSVNTDEDALKVINSLTNSQHSKYKKSERDVFVDVWARINAKENADRREDMISAFRQNLATGVEKGLVVCSTGKIMRMLGSLDAIDSDPALADPLKPEWAVNQELAGMAASIRKAAIGKVDSREYEANDALQAKLSEEMRETMRTRTKEEYVDAGIITAADAEVRLRPLLDAL